METNIETEATTLMRQNQPLAELLASCAPIN